MSLRCAAVAAALFLFFSVVGASDRTLNFPITFQNGLSGYFIVQAPEVGSTPKIESRADGNFWTNDLFQIRFSETSGNGRNAAVFEIASLSGRPLEMNSISFGVFVPAAKIDGVWTPSGRISDNRLISADPGNEFITYSEANYGIPYLGAATATGGNVVGAGLLEQDLSVELRAGPSQNGLYYFQIKANVPPNRTSMSYQFFLSNDSTRDWFRTAERYADWVDAGTHYQQFPISARAYRPKYDTWYWSQDQVDDNLYFESARAMAADGLGTFVADSGWDAMPGEYDKWLLGSTGNYTPSAQQFPDLPATFEALRSTFNLQIQLWLQPFAVGRTSVRYPQTRELHIQVPQTSNSASLAPGELPIGSNRLEDVNLCPQTSATHQYLRGLFSEIASRYHPEGYWLDFIDGVPAYCVAPHKHDFDTFGQGLTAAMAAIRDTIRTNDPDAIVEFRAQYANLNNKPFGNVWQPFDSPNNFDRMRLDTLRLRPFSKGVVFATDELYWPETDNDITVARFVMTDVMTGVPSIGANLMNSRPSSNLIVKNWMNFYSQYQQDLTTGRFRPLGSFRVPDHAIESNNRVFVYIRSQDRVRFSVSSQKQIFLMNASDVRRVQSSVSVSGAARYSVQAYDRYLQPEGAATELAIGGPGVFEIDAVVRRGGMLVLTPVS